MADKTIAIINYGLGNLQSVTNALKSLDAKVVITDDLSTIRNSQALILPGVGAFYRGIENLKDRNLTDIIHDEINRGKPLLGICLGFQLLFTQSEEHGISLGLDIIKGNVCRFKAKVKIPHMGWNQIDINTANRQAHGTLLKGIPDKSYLYFVHSYRVIPEDLEITATTTTYGEKFTSAIVKDNIYATQFHPERSGPTGLRILKNFINLIK